MAAHVHVHVHVHPSRPCSLNWTTRGQWCNPSNDLYGLLNALEHRKTDLGAQLGPSGLQRYSPTHWLSIKNVRFQRFPASTGSHCGCKWVLKPKMAESRARLHPIQGVKRLSQCTICSRLCFKDTRQYISFSMGERSLPRLSGSICSACTCACAPK